MNLILIGWVGKEYLRIKSSVYVWSLVFKFTEIAVRVCDVIVLFMKYDNLAVCEGEIGFTFFF